MASFKEAIGHLEEALAQVQLARQEWVRRQQEKLKELERERGARLESMATSGTTAPEA